MDRMGRVSLPFHRKRFGLGGERHKKLNFKSFVALKEDQISPEKAFEEYAKYLVDFLNNEITLYYDKYGHLPFFREKYHPFFLERGFELLRATYENLRAEFIAAGKFNELRFEVSYKRLYGKESTDEHPLPESAYLLTDWALELPVEYPPDEATFKRLQLKTPLENSLLVDVPSGVFVFELAEVLRPFYPSLPIYFAEHNDIRTAFITVPDSEDLYQVSDVLNSQKVKLNDIVLSFRPCNPIRERLPAFVCPPLCSHPIIMERDLHITEALIRKLDMEMGRRDSSLADLLPDDMDPRLRLDVQILYLRKVHNYCYYGKYKSSNYVDLWDSSGPGYMRVDTTNELFDREEGVFPQNPRIRFATFDPAKADKNPKKIGNWEEELKSTTRVAEEQVLWVKDVEAFALKILQTKFEPPEFEASEGVEERWRQFCNLNTLLEAPDKFRCKLCSKLFNEAKFVWKHLKKVHAEAYKQVIVECGLATMRDIFVSIHKDARTNPFETLVSVPVVQRPNPAFDDETREFFKRAEAHQPDRKRRREYYDFDQPKLKRDIVTFAPDEYSRPSVKYDDL